MTVMDYVGRFTELARFADDYVAMDMAKVRRFENGLKLSIRGRIVGLCLPDMDSMVGITLTIEREIEDARSTRDAGVSSKRKESQYSSSSGKKQRASSSHEFQGRDHPGQGWVRVASQAGYMVCYNCQQPGHIRRDCPRDKDPRVLGQRSPSQRWDRRGYSIFLHSPVQARGASIKFREPHGCLPLHRQAREARLWAEAEDEAHRQGRQGFRGVSTVRPQKNSDFLRKGKIVILLKIQNFYRSWMTKRTSPLESSCEI